MENAPMSDSDIPPTVTHSFVERRSGVDIRSVEEQKRVGERRSGLDRRQTIVSSAEDYARRALQASSIDEKLNFLAQAVMGMAASLAGIERRMKLVQKNTADHSSF
jgi:hypothetical protein